MANRSRDFGRSGFSQDPNQPYNWDPRGYRFDWENEEYRNRSQGRNRGYEGRSPGEYPESYSSGRFRNASYGDYEEGYEPTTWYYEEVWLVPGPFSGIGPRGYQRSDDAICEVVSERLASHGHLDASEMDVDVQNGEVILRGNVPDRRSKRLAEQIADSVTGIKDVRNELKINSEMTRRHQSQQHMMSGYDRESDYATQQTNTAYNQGMEAGGTGTAGTRTGGMGTSSSRSMNLREGQEVVGAQGKPLGTVKEVHQYDFVLNRPMQPDVHVPFTEIKEFTGNRIHLNVSSDQVDKQGWKHI